MMKSCPLCKKKFHDDKRQDLFCTDLCKRLFFGRTKNVFSS